MKKTTLSLLILSSILFIGCQQKKKSNPSVEAISKSKNPNVIIIYMDDLGYGDLSSYGAKTLNTPNMDRIVDGGVKFTNGYATSATCSPSRYALLTGEYPWRNENAKILPGTAPMLIDIEQTTLPKVFKKAGYKTGIIGKWHLGLADGNINWNKKISPGPNEVGFDYSYIMAATQDRVPTVYIKDGLVENLDPDDPIEVSYEHNFEGEPTGVENPELLEMKWHHGHNNSIVNGIPRIGYMKGGEKAKWDDKKMSFHFLEKVKGFIQKDAEDKPFFLYYAMQQPHVPRTPAPEFVGKSGMGPRGDVILEADYCIGQLLNTLENRDLLENTLIIFTSDNGPVLNDGYFDNAVEKLGNHDAAGGLRGGKYSLFEAGTRVPFATYWKGKIKPAINDAIISQVDLLSSLASLVGENATTDDSKNLLDVLVGKSSQGRNAVILEATGRTALRSGDYVLIPPYKGPEVLKQVDIEIGNSDGYQLYNVTEDPGQQMNLVKSKPEKLNEMLEEFKTIRGEFESSNKTIELK
ncbi:sulfatase family protein [Galbibacter mesophilus]|uniref:sulfatase family protein n=1 Tax=Galbibacter mesophilus TaxID=379069 RepID=UPI00191F2B5B|nr:arylsulfatase [Galbibacter mesophilus]MCM5664030.1 arylsulfatase [Galbibacter mesophilus]